MLFNRKKKTPSAQSSQRITDEQFRELMRQREMEYRERVRVQEQLAREQIRQAKEQKRLAEEQRKQAALLAKHDEQIAKLEYRMDQAEADIAHWKEAVGKLYALLDLAEAEQAASVPGSKTDVACQKRIITLTNQIHTAESKLRKAAYERNTAQSKLGA
ncbi:MAG: hypothetical protein J6S14_02200 [Clostridia bacterium]|nr:hypothetical protein [Clostridia bacterium]